MSHYGHLCCNSSWFLCGSSRSSAGYTPLDFAFVVAGSKGVIEVLDRDRQLPREGNPVLDGDIVEVRMETSVSDVKRCGYYLLHHATYCGHYSRVATNQRQR